jgi:hypothetical protein
VREESDPSCWSTKQMGREKTKEVKQRRPYFVKVSTKANES